MIGALAAMHFKQKYNRPRPSQYRPALLPPIPIPGHASYPSGHATQAHLMALLLGEALSALGSPHQAALQTTLGALARRIARNREIAGLHFPSDSAGGQQLAASIFAAMQKQAQAQAGGAFQEAFAAAKAEWATHFGPGHAADP